MARTLISFWALFSYSVTRAMSYVTDPRPYLWWHGVIDLAATVVILSVQFWGGRKKVQP